MIINKDKSAFSLIELMVVIAIVGILSAVALPAYKNYLIRARVIEGMSIAERALNDIKSVYDLEGRYPIATTDDYDVTGKYASIISAGSGLAFPQSYWLMLEYDNAATGLDVGADNLLIFLTYVDKGVFHVVCGQWTATGYIALEYLPVNCQNENVVNISNTYGPAGDV